MALYQCKPCGEVFEGEGNTTYICPFCHRHVAAYNGQPSNQTPPVRYGLPLQLSAEYLATSQSIKPT